MVNHPEFEGTGDPGLKGKRMAVVSFSHFPGDPRPRRAAEAFASAGMSIDVICLMEEGGPKEDVFEGIHIDRISITHRRGSKIGYVLRYGLFILIAFLKLAKRCFSERYHIVHIHNMPDVLVLAALVPKLLGAKVILDLHDPMPELMMAIFELPKASRAVRGMVVLERWSIAIADIVLTVNRTFEELFSSRSCSVEKVQVIMNSPDDRIFKIIPPQMRNSLSDKKRTPFVIMYHGTLVERNGIDLAVEALVRVRKLLPEAELRIYGQRTPFLDQVLQGAIEKGIEKAVCYLGPRRLEQLVDAIADCDVGIIPNKRSIFTELNTPVRIFEYLALGRPVIAPRAPGIQEYFTDDSLVFFDLGDVEDLARKLTWVADHPKEVLEITERGQAVCCAHSWGKEKAKLLKVAGDLVCSHQ
jgi:glycosyltransferase involved in cell wall biosynthesis